MNIQVEGFIGFLLLVINVWAIVRIVQSNTSTGKKVLWIVLILLLPLLGVILWWFLGPKG